MEDALKARLIGASILVLLAVVLLPELLSGPKPLPGAAGGSAGKGTRTVTIDLGGAVAVRLPGHATTRYGAGPRDRGAHAADRRVPCRDNGRAR